MIKIPVTFFEDVSYGINVHKLYKCWDCKDTGELERYTWDLDHGYSVWDGYRACHCQF